MSEFFATLVPALGHALVQFTWQGLVIGALAAIALRLARTARPQVRYAIGCVALLACVLVPLVTVLLQFADAAPTAFALRDAVPVRLDGNGIAVGADMDWQARLDAALPRIVALWAAGASLFCLRTLFGIAWVRRMRTLPQPPLQARWQATVDRLASRFDLDGVALKLVDALDSPVAAGWWRPVVLLPVSVALHLPAPYVEALLAHELAHVRRHDYLVNLLQRAVEALLFFHPVTWWLSRRVRIERELIADQLAAEAIGDPRRLALALAALSERVPTSTPTLPHVAHAAHGGHLMSRIQHLLQNKSRTTKGGQPTGRVALPLIGVAAACIAFYAQAQIGKDAQKATTEQTAAETAAAIAAAAPEIARESAEAVAAAAPEIAAASAKAAADAAPEIAEATAAAVAANAAQIAAESAKAAAAAAPVIAAQAAQATAATAAGQAAQWAQASQSAQVTRFNDDNDRDAWALVRKNEDGYSMSGSTSDMREIDNAKRALQNDFVWFRRDGKAYVIDDPSIVSRARAAWKDSDALGERMSTLGAQMEVHGKKMEAYGAKMEKLAQGHQPSPALQQAQERMGTLAEQQQALAGKQQLLAMKMRKADNDAEEAKLDRDMNALGEQMNALGDQMEAQGKIMERESAKLAQNQAPMEALGREMEEASKPMDALGKQMGELGKQQEVLVRKAEKQLNALIAEAQQKGLVKPAPGKQ